MGVRTRGFVFLTASFLIWSSWVVPVRRIGAGALTITLFSSMFAALIWGVYCAVRFGRNTLLPAPALARLFFMGLFFLLNILCYLGALQYTDAAVAVLTHYTAPIFVALLAPFFLNERITRRVLLSLGLAATGFVVIFGRNIPTGGNYLLGTLLGVASGVFYAFIILLAKKLIGTLRGELMLFYQNVTGALIMLCAVPFIDMPADPAFLGNMALLAFFYPVVGSWLYMRGLKTVGGIQASIIGYVEPLGTIAWGWIFFGEAITMRTVMGGLLIMYSGFLVSRQEEH